MPQHLTSGKRVLLPTSGISAWVLGSCSCGYLIPSLLPLFPDLIRD